MRKIKFLGVIVGFIVFGAVLYTITKEIVFTAFVMLMAYLAMTDIQESIKKRDNERKRYKNEK